MIEYLVLGIFLVETGLSIYDAYKFNKLQKELNECKDNFNKSNKNSNLIKRIDNKYQE